MYEKTDGRSWFNFERIVRTNYLYVCERESKRERLEVYRCAERQMAEVA